MKKPYLLLIFTLVIVLLVEAKSSTKKQPIKNPDLKGYILAIQPNVFRSYDTIIHKKTYTIFHIPVKLINSTKAPLKYITMTCSWDDLFHLDNKHFKIPIVPCESNFPAVKTLFPNKSSIFILPIIKERRFVGGEILKIGMNLFIDNKQNEALFPLPVNKLDNVIWSNEIKIP